jgi:hypothetical protein
MHGCQSYSSLFCNSLILQTLAQAHLLAIEINQEVDYELDSDFAEENIVGALGLSISGVLILFIILFTLHTTNVSIG